MKGEHLVHSMLHCWPVLASALLAPPLCYPRLYPLSCPTRHNRVRAFRILSGRPWVFRQLYKVASHKWFETFIILVRGVDPVAPRLLMFLLEG
jgi:hypothetical protein